MRTSAKERNRELTTEKPLENIKPRRGMVVRLLEEPGLWQVMDHAPKSEGPAAWWLNPYDEAARAALPHAVHGRYRSGSWKTMRPADGLS